MKHYITQYGFWWSAPPGVWRSLCAHAIANGCVYDLDQFPGIQPLLRRPSTVRFDGQHYFDTAGHCIHRPLDWTEADWRLAEDEMGSTLGGET